MGGTPFSFPADDPVNITTNIDVTNLSNGLHRLFIRFRDSDGKWSQTENYNVLVKHPVTTPIAYGEYFFDQIVDYGEGNAFSFSPDNPATIFSSINIESLSDGLHRLFVRFRDGNGYWTQTENYNVLVKHSMVAPIIRGEYFFDTMVAYGEGETLNLANTSSSIDSVLQEINILNLNDGLHRLFIRFQTANGLWTQTENYNVLVKHRSCTIIEAGEYFRDNLLVDFGQGIPIDLSNPGEDVTINDLFVMPDNFSGEHVVYYRFRNNCGVWSHTYADTINTGVNFGLYTTSESTYCTGDQISLVNLAGPNQDAIFNWDLDGDGVFDDRQTNGESFLVGIATGSSIQYAYNVISPCASPDQIFTVDVNIGAGLQIDAEVTNVRCAGENNGSIDISVSPFGSDLVFEWSTGATTEDLSNLSANTYSVIITNSEGCTTEASFSVGEPSELSVELEETGVVNDGNSDGFILVDILGGTQPYNCQYTLNGVVAATQCDPINLEDGEYALTVMDANGCLTTLENICVGVIEGKYEPENPPYCAGENFLLVNDEPLLANVLFDWDLDNNFIYDDGQTDGQGLVIVNDSPGTFTYRYRVSSPICPSFQKEDSVVVGVDPIPQLIGQFTSASCSNVCDGEITVSDTLMLSDSYLWSNGAMMDTLRMLCPGDYTVTVTNEFNCTSEKPFTISAPPALDVVVDEITDATDGNANGAIEITVMGGTPGYEFIYVLNGDTISMDEDPMNLPPGVYDLTIVDQNGCVFWETIAVDNIVNTLDFQNQNAIRLFPNPAKHTAYLTFDLSQATAVSIDLINNLGQVVRQFESVEAHDNTIELQLQSLPAGIYLIRIRDDNTEQVKRLLIR